MPDQPPDEDSIAALFARRTELLVKLEHRIALWKWVHAPERMAPWVACDDPRALDHSIMNVTENLRSLTQMFNVNVEEFRKVQSHPGLREVLRLIEKAQKELAVLKAQAEARRTVLMGEESNIDPHLTASFDLLTSLPLQEKLDAEIAKLRHDISSLDVIVTSRLFGQTRN